MYISDEFGSHFEFSGHFEYTEYSKQSIDAFSVLLSVYKQVIIVLYLQYTIFAKMAAILKGDAISEHFL